jgi:hypothetical protein
MDDIIIVRNRSTKVESRLTLSQWKAIRNAPRWKGVFERVKTIHEPPEVVALKAKKATQKPGNIKFH